MDMRGKVEMQKKKLPIRKLPIKKLPIGVENFEEMRKEDFYYVDKTGLITELLHNWGVVNLFTRPRRFWMGINVFLTAWKFQRKLRFVKDIWENTRLFLFL